MLEDLVNQGSFERGITFNLCTIYELCADQSQALKLDLAKKAASQPPTSTGWDRTNADFKL